MLLEERADDWWIMCIFLVCWLCGVKASAKKDGWDRMEKSQAKEKETASEEVDDFTAECP